MITDIFLLITVYVYVLLIIAVGIKLREAGFKAGLTRKMIHLFAGDSIIILPLFSSRWWPAMIPIGLALGIGLIFTFAKESSISKAMIETGDVKAHAYGPVYYIISILALVLLFWNYQFVAIASTFIMAWGDGMASIIAAKAKNRHRFPFGSRSLEGSTAMFLFSLLGSIVSLAGYNLLGSALPLELGLKACLTASLAATAAEALTEGPIRHYDNFTVPAVASLILWLILGC